MKTWREVAIETSTVYLAESRKYAALVARLEALAAEADAGGDHPTAARIRAALWGDDGEGEGE